MAESSESGVKGRRPIVVALIVASLVVPQLALPAFAQTEGAYEVCLLDEINDSRAAAGAGAVTMASDLVPEVRDYSEWMRHHSFQHMSGSARDAILPNGTFTWGENIAMWGDPSAPCARVHDMLMNSPGHRANILNPNFRYVALGAHIDSSGEWVTELFFNANGYTPGINGRFWDDDISIFEGAIEKFAAAGITQGCNPPVNDRFCPDDYVTRGMMAAFLVRGLGLTDPGNVDFVDDNGSTFESAIEKLAAAGYHPGMQPAGQRPLLPQPIRHPGDDGRLPGPRPRPHRPGQRRLRRRQRIDLRKRDREAGSRRDHPGMQPAPEQSVLPQRRGDPGDDGRLPGPRPRSLGPYTVHGYP